MYLFIVYVILALTCGLGTLRVGRDPAHSLLGHPVAGEGVSTEVRSQ